jgi:hypothetical protein
LRGLPTARRPFRVRASISMQRDPGMYASFFIIFFHILFCLVPDNLLTVLFKASIFRRSVDVFNTFDPTTNDRHCLVGFGAVRGYGHCVVGFEP